VIRGAGTAEADYAGILVGERRVIAAHAIVEIEPGIVGEVRRSGLGRIVERHIAIVMVVTAAVPVSLKLQIPPALFVRLALLAVLELLKLTVPSLPMVAVPAVLELPKFSTGSQQADP
jgi:hypothetical protein